MSFDFKFIIYWWLCLLLLGLPAIPYVFKIFAKFWDKGYIFSKIFSLITLTYILFVLSFFRLIPFNQVAIASILAVLCLVSFLFIRNKYPSFNQTVKKNYKIFIFEEVIFLSVLIAWSFIRGFQPDIEGLEKFMDWGFINSSLRSKYLPPTDMWYASEPINYYYFGHLIFALITKFSGISSAITYNLSIATVCALTFVSTFSLGSNLVALLKNKLKNLIIGGLISALMLTFGGNFHPIYKIAKNNIETNGRLTLTKEAIVASVSNYWYPDATRFIGFDPDIEDKTIHEFPIYSFVVADLHGHMNDIPIVLFFMAFLLVCLLSQKKKNTNWFMAALSGFILSVSFMTNAWDFAVYGLLFAVAYFLTNVAIGLDYVQNIKQTFIHGVLIIIFWYLFTLPFSLNFIPMAEGLRLSDSRTPFYQLSILYGGFWLICLPFVLIFLKKIITKHKTPVMDYYVIALILTATILILIPELIYLKDIYIYEHRRANTMFKLVYQAFMIYSLVSGYLFYRFKSFLYRILIFIVLIIHLIYPYFAIKSYYSLKSYQGLWGLNFLKNTYPDNYQAIDWLNKNVVGQPTIVEAVGDSYTTFNQVSVATGLPTIQGWVVHEWLWRGGYDAPAARQEEVRLIYENGTIDEIMPILQKYSVKYIFVGDKEYEKYPELNEKKFIDLGAQVVFQSGQTKIYEL